MLSQKMQDVINEQIKNELHSAYIYLSMSAYFEDANLPGGAHWMRMQYEEEMVHTMKLFDYMIDRGGRIVLLPIDQPPSDFASPLAIFEQALKHEQFITGTIHKLYALAVEEGDYPTQSMLQWFIDEQVEEEKNAGDIVAQLKMIGDSGTATYLIDQQLAARMPAAAAE